MLGTKLFGVRFAMGWCGTMPDMISTSPAKIHLPKRHATGGGGVTAILLVVEVVAPNELAAR